MSTRLSLIVYLSILLPILSGCSSVIHKRFTIDSTPATTVSLDAKQRLVLVTDKGGKDNKKRIVCAEPSPDAMVGLAASGALEGLMPGNGSAKIAASMAETLAQLGDRTPVIQLLRDGLYRACEAQMNGLLSDKEYKTLLVGYDDFVITLLAIEGLTHHRNSKPVVVQAQTEVKFSDGQEARTTPIVDNLNQANGGTSGGSVSKEVAETVRSILSDYYNLQKSLYCVGEGGSWDDCNK
jgi:hypothetical protein